MNLCIEQTGAWLTVRVRCDKDSGCALALSINEVVMAYHKKHGLPGIDREVPEASAALALGMEQKELASACDRGQINGIRRVVGDRHHGHRTYFQSELEAFAAMKGRKLDYSKLD